MPPYDYYYRDVHGSLYLNNDSECKCVLIRIFILSLFLRFCSTWQLGNLAFVPHTVTHFSFPLCYLLASIHSFVFISIFSPSQ